MSQIYDKRMIILQMLLHDLLVFPDPNAHSLKVHVVSSLASKHPHTMYRNQIVSWLAAKYPEKCY